MAMNSYSRERRRLASIVVDSRNNQDNFGEVFRRRHHNHNQSSSSLPILRSHRRRRRGRGRGEFRADWDSLPCGLMIDIAERMEVYEDFEVMNKVSRQWRSAMKMANFSSGGRSIQYPWLMLSPKEERGTTARCYSLSKDMFRWMDLPEKAAQKRKPIRSSRGWLLLILSEGRSLSLYNPLSRAHVQLPDNSSLLDYNTRFLNFPVYVDKFCVSCSPCCSNPDDDFQVMILTNKRESLALWRPGDTDWTHVETRHVVSCRIENVTYCKGEIIAIMVDGQVVACNAGSIDTWRMKKNKKSQQKKAEDMVKVRLIADVLPLLRRTHTEPPMS